MSHSEPKFLIWENRYPVSELKSIVDRFKLKGRKETSNNHKSGRKKTQSAWLHSNELLDLNIFRDISWNCVNANKEKFGYNLFESHIQDCLYNCYKGPSGEYKWHMDDSFGQENDVKLSAIINLSQNKYTGGEFQLHMGNHIDVSLNPGTMIIFRSQTLHRVKPIKSGTRETMTIFWHGPKLQ